MEKAAKNSTKTANKSKFLSFIKIIKNALIFYSFYKFKLILSLFSALLGSVSLSIAPIFIKNAIEVLILYNENTDQNLDYTAILTHSIISLCLILLASSFYFISIIILNSIKNKLSKKTISSLNFDFEDDKNIDFSFDKIDLFFKNSKNFLLKSSIAISLIISVLVICATINIYLFIILICAFIVFFALLLSLTKHQNEFAFREVSDKNKLKNAIFDNVDCLFLIKTCKKEDAESLRLNLKSDKESESFAKCQKDRNLAKSSSFIAFIVGFSVILLVFLLMSLSFNLGLEIIAFFAMSSILLMFSAFSLAKIYFLGKDIEENFEFCYETLIKSV